MSAAESGTPDAGPDAGSDAGPDRRSDAISASGALTMDVLLFAGLAEALGRTRLTLGPPWPGTVAELRERLHQEWPDLARATFRTAVNQRYVSDAEPVQPGDEIALIPPVSGG